MPSPLVFEIAQPDGSAEVVKGYCSKRKDSLAMHKTHDGRWVVTHKATGMDISEAMPANLANSYPQVLKWMDHVQANTAIELARLDELPFNPTASARANAAREIFRIRDVGRQYNG